MSVSHFNVSMSHMYVTVCVYPSVTSQGTRAQNQVHSRGRGRWRSDGRSTAHTVALLSGTERSPPHERSDRQPIREGSLKCAVQLTFVLSQREIFATMARFKNQHNTENQEIFL